MSSEEETDKRIAEKKKRLDELVSNIERKEKEYNAVVEKGKKVIIALDVTGEEDPSFTDEQNAAIAAARELRELQRKIILQVGEFLEEKKLVPLDSICRKLKREFRGHISPKFIEDNCPPEWKPNN